MKTAGQLLKEAREKNEKSLGHIARETKIKEKFLLALEEANYSVLPNVSIAQGFARNYAQAVDINPGMVTALLRRDFPHSRAGLKIKDTSVFQKPFWTPRTTILFAVFITILVLGAYLVRQYMLFAGPPPLEVKRVVVGQDYILVLGRTSPAATVQINGETVLVDESGNFKADIKKEEAAGSIEVRARSRAGKDTLVKKPVDGNW